MGMITKTLKCLPPQIVQRFSEILLCTPCKLHHDESDLWKIWIYIEKKLWHKLEKTPSRKLECEQLKNQFLDTYERIKTKKENGQAKEKNKTEECLYWINCSSRRNDEIFTRLRYRTIQNGF